MNFFDFSNELIRVHKNASFPIYIHTNTDTWSYIIRVNCERTQIWWIRFAMMKTARYAAQQSITFFQYTFTMRACMSNGQISDFFFVCWFSSLTVFSVYENLMIMDIDACWTHLKRNSSDKNKRNSRNDLLSWLFFTTLHFHSWMIRLIEQENNIFWMCME